MTTRYLQGISVEETKHLLAQLKEEGSRDSKVRQLAELAIIGREDQVAAVYKFVRDTFPYQADPENAELFIHPKKVAQDYFHGRIRRFDCDDFALLTSSMLSSLGHETRILLVEKHGPGLDHALAQVKTPMGWLSVDAVNDKPMGWLENYKRVVPVP